HDNVFFFSSRRRHTRSKRDWSSDVCSSDLRLGLAGSRRTQQRRPSLRRSPSSSWDSTSTTVPGYAPCSRTTSWRMTGDGRDSVRSEERRVGKECRCRGGGGHERKNVSSWQC